MPDGPAQLPHDWQTEIERLTPRLICWAAWRLPGRPHADAEDLAQDVVCRAWLRREQFTGGNFRAWIFQIAKNVLLEHARRLRKVGRVHLAEGHTSRLDVMAQISDQITTLVKKIVRRDDVQRLLKVVEGLDEVDRRLAVLCGMEDMSAREAAVVVGLSEAATSKRWYRVRQMLRESCDWLGP